MEENEEASIEKHNEAANNTASSGDKEENKDEKVT